MGDALSNEAASSREENPDSVGDGARHSAPEWMTSHENPMMHGLATAFTVIDTQVQDDLARRIFEHIRVQTAVNPPPAGYQFVLPNGSLLSLYDDHVGNRRRLGLHAPRGPSKSFEVIRAWAWPRRTADHGAWFSWPMSDRKLRKVHADIGYAVRVAFANRSEERRPRTTLLDPYADPSTSLR